MVKTVTAKAVSTLDERNALAKAMTPPTHELTMDDVNDKDSVFWQGVPFPGAADNISPCVKRELVQLLCQRDRAGEEVLFAKDDARLGREHVWACLVMLRNEYESWFAGEHSEHGELYVSGAMAMLAKELARMVAEVH